jgi:hypothetical protein
LCFKRKKDLKKDPKKRFFNRGGIFKERILQKEFQIKKFQIKKNVKKASKSKEGTRKKKNFPEMVC